MSISTLLDQTFSIQRPAIAQDASGGAGRTFATIAGSVPCAVSPARASVVADYARRDMIVDWHIYTTADLDTLLIGGLQLGDRFTDGVVFYLVKAVKKSANKVIGNEVIYQVDCEKIS